MKKNARMEVVYHEREYRDRYAGDNMPNEIDVTITRWSKAYPDPQEVVVLERKVVHNCQCQVDTQNIMRNGTENAQLQRFGIKQFDELKADHPYVLAEVSE